MPIGGVLWHRLGWALQRFAQMFAGAHLLAYIEALLDAGYLADANANLDADALEGLVMLCAEAIAGMALMGTVLWRMVFSASSMPLPGQPAPGPSASPSA